MTILQFVRSYYPFVPTVKQARDVIDYVIRYELKGDNPQAFNTPYLGIKYGVFLPTTAQGIFDIFNVYKQDFDKKLKEVSSIDQNFNTVSDGFNVFCVILAYKFLTVPSIPQKLAIDAFKAIMKLMTYRFFTGAVRTSFKHKVNEGVMEYTLDNLSAKSDIKTKGTDTWKLVMESHVDSLLETTSPYYHVLHTFNDDVMILRVITDARTRIAQKIIKVAQDYYDNHKAGNTISSVDAHYNENEEGESELRAIKANLDNKIVKICGQCLNINSLINFSHMRLTASLCNGIRPDMVNEMLQNFSAVASIQAKNGLDEAIAKVDGKEIYLGYRKLINEVIQKSYRYAVLNSVDMESNLKVLESARNVFRASRVQDEDILKIKDSIDHFIINNMQYKREATQVAMRTAFIVYFMLLTF